MVVGALAAGCGDDGADNNSGDSGDNTGAAESNDGGDGETAELPKFCDLLTPDQVSAAVGAAVTLTTGPFDACEFKQEDPRAVSGSVGSVEVDTGNGGFDGYQSGITGTLTNPVEHPVEGLGDGAFVTTGTFGTGESLQTAGGVLVGGTVHTVNLSQASGMAEGELVAIAEKLLQLLVDAA
ncbi:hypothetical protein ASD81_10620 [Nocardioides sp. Root614]|nr:hypothetical protein ASD81_10620 [Nocardioides sp. Root614]KRA92966.1 hypothetical protein ASD84_10885 [Nocardioides sp. Root682]